MGARLDAQAERGAVMAEVNHVVARFKDGRVLKGTTGDFYPNRSFFHLQAGEGADAMTVKCEHLKAVFFVKDLEGNPLYDERPEFLHSPDQGVKGKKVAIRFQDGEVVFGYTMAYAPNRPGFFVTPADPHSNKIGRAHV